MHPHFVDSRKALSPLEALPLPARETHAGGGTFARHLTPAAESPRPTPAATQPPASAAPSPATARTDADRPRDDQHRRANEDDETLAAEERSPARAESEAAPLVAPPPVIIEETLTGGELEDDALRATTILVVTAENSSPLEIPTEDEVSAANAASDSLSTTPGAPTQGGDPKPENLSPSATAPAQPTITTIDTNAPHAANEAISPGVTAAATTLAETEVLAPEGDEAHAATAATFATAETTAKRGPTGLEAERRAGAERAASRERSSHEQERASDAATVENPREAVASGARLRDARRERGRTEHRPGSTQADSPHGPSSATAESAAPPAASPAAALGESVLSEGRPATTTSSASAPAPTATPPATGDAASPGQRLPPHLLTRSAAPRGNSGAPVTPAEQTRFVMRVAKAFETAQARGGELQLRLSPPALGSLKLEIKVQEGVLTARIEAEQAIARSALLENLPALKERLAEQGIVVEKFDVELMDRQPQRDPQFQQDQQRRATTNSDWRAPRGTPPAETSTAPPESGRPPLQDGRLNVTI